MNRIPPLPPDWKLCSPVTEALHGYLLFFIVCRLETSEDMAYIPGSNDAKKLIWCLTGSSLIL